MMLLLWITEVNLIVFFFLGICSLDGEFGVQIPNKKKGNGAMRMEERERWFGLFNSLLCDPAALQVPAPVF